MDQPNQPAPAPAGEQRAKSTPKEVFMNYGVASVPLIGWVIWCIRDGWFNPGYSHIGFSRVMAIISTPILIFCLVMATSAGLAWRRQLASAPPPPTAPPSP